MKSFTHLRLALISATVVILYAPASLTAGVAINVDFNSIGQPSGTYVGTAAAPDSGTIWNGVALRPRTSAIRISRLPRSSDRPAVRRPR